MKFKLTLLFSILVAFLIFNSCKKTEKQLVGDWKLDSLYINGVKQPTSDTCMRFTIQRNMDQFFLKNYNCTTNQHVSTSEGVWELKDKKKTLKLTFTQSTTTDPLNKGIWNWNILEFTDQRLTIEFSSFNKYKYEFKRI